MKLSILIPSLTCRPQHLSKILSVLDRQIKKDVEILISIDNADKQIGTKRNELLERANGEYVVFIDDDDMVSAKYIDEVMKGIESGLDYISYPQIFHFTERNTKNLVLSKIGQPNSFDQKTGTYRRGVQHICPIKRKLALTAKFPDKSFAEDTAWGKEIEKVVKTQYTINEPMYFYEYRQNKQHETTNGFKV